MTWYLTIEALQEPMDLGLDGSSRVQCGFNVEAQRRWSDVAFLDEVVLVLEAAGVGVRAASIFVSSKATLPPGPGPFLLVRATGSAGPVGTHNAGPAAYQRPRAQLVAHAESWPAAESMARAAYNALVATRNREVPA